MGYKIGIDIGGTFTDLLGFDEAKQAFITKVLTTPKNPVEGLMQGLERIARGEKRDLRGLLGDTDLIAHGTTLAANAMIEKNGALTGMITTQGFRDTLEFRRGFKEKVFDPRYPAPYPIVRRQRRLTVEERINSEGEVVIPLNEEEAVSAIQRLKGMGVESIAVCFLFSFLSPGHEKRVGELIQREFPEAFVSLSHEILPAEREYERFSTTVVNAYVSPKLMSYLADLERTLRENGYRQTLWIMQSNGGAMSLDYVGRNAVLTLHSGPAGGIVGSSTIGKLAGHEDFIAIDMGGTSYDVCLVRKCRPQITTDTRFERYRIALPMMDIHNIGAGGGSIAWVDAGGALKVGPQSAGADPGPICYGRGGSEPTVTDANLLLGYLNPDYFLGGEMQLVWKNVREVIQEKLADPLGIDVVEAANGVFRIVNHNMNNAIRVVSVQKGHDPRDFSLMAYGGNGALHAGIQARELGIKKVIVPKTATAFSALGLLCADVTISKLRAYRTRSDALDIEQINDLYDSMGIEAKKELSGLERESSILLERYVDCRYEGQAHDLTVPLGGQEGRVTASDLREAVSSFHEMHENLHTFSNQDQPVELKLLRLQVRGLTWKPEFRESGVSGEKASGAIKGKRPVYFSDFNEFRDTTLYDGNRIGCGQVIEGPCIIEEPATTIVVYPGQVATLNRFECYEITVGE